MYKEDLLWVWRERGASIIRTNRDPSAPPTTSNNIHSQTWAWPQTTVAGAETLYIYMKMIWMSIIIRWVGCLKTFSMITNYKSKTERILIAAASCCCCWFFLPPRVVSVWGCILIMTTRQSRRCWNTVHMYEVDLLWVWTGWVPTINGNLQHIANQETLLLPVKPRIYQCRGCWIIMTCSHCSRWWIALYMYEEDLIWVWRECGASIIRTNRDPPATPTISTLRSQRADIRVWQHSYYLQPL
jgi:hypothetical protein